MKLFYLALVLVVSGGMLAGSLEAAQSTADTPVTMQMKQKLRADILGDQAAKVTEEEYRIGHGDLIGVSVYGEGDMAASLAAQAARPGETPGATGTTATATAPDSQRGIRVMMDGRVSLLHIGDVEVVGMTLTELADYLKQLYASVYGSPIVTTTLIQSNSQRYTVMGKVTTPGVFYLDYPITIVQTLARTGGLTEWASGKIILIRDRLRPGDERMFKDNKLEFDFDRFVSGKDLEKNVSLRAGDIIIVE